LLHALLRAATVATSIFAVGGVLLSEFQPARDALPLLAIPASIVALRFANGLPFKVRALLTVAVFEASALFWLARVGFALGTGAALSAAVVVAVLLLGRRFGFGVLITMALAVLAIGVATRAGYLVQRLTDSDPHLLRNWVRMALTLALLSAALAVAVDYVVRQTESKYLEAAAALARQLEEEQRRTNLELERAEERRTWERSARELIALGKLDVIEAGDAPAAFRAICEAGARGLDVERCSVWLLDEAMSSLRCVNLYERRPNRHGPGLELAEAGAPVYFAALREERALAFRDARSDPRSQELAPSYLVPLGIGAMLDAPVRYRDRLSGVVCHEHVGPPRPWTAAEQSFAGSLADFAARALFAADRSARERALRVAYDELGLLHRRLESAKEEERRFIAHELHDQLGQTLTALKLRLTMQSRAPANGERPSDTPSSIALVDGLIDRVRRLSLDLRPPLLDELGLMPALSAYLDQQAAISGVHMSLDGPTSEIVLSPELQSACFRIVQEAITNVLRHADAQVVTVQIVYQGARIELTIRDDGRGFEPEEVLDTIGMQAHIGVLGMRERARALGGNFALFSRPGAGTTIDVRLPVS
jgi:signal transduction histidine kinase